MPHRANTRGMSSKQMPAAAPKMVRVVGVPYLVERERTTDPAREDHVWITFHAPPFGQFRAVVNTISQLNARAGFDARVRVGIVPSSWSEMPAPVLVEGGGLDYAAIESETPVFYEPLDHEMLVALLIDCGKRAIRIEVWGELYARDHVGIHQIHSRRASSAVPLDLRNRDGALKFYYLVNNAAELFLFKFSGQP